MLGSSVNGPLSKPSFCSLSKAPARTTSVEDEPEEEEGPSLLEAYRIIKNERYVAY